MKNKFKSYTFWMSLASAFILIVQNLGLAFGFVVNEELIMNIINAVCGVLVVLGIITNPAKKEVTNTVDVEEYVENNELSKTNENGIADE